MIGAHVSDTVSLVSERRREQERAGVSAKQVIGGVALAVFVLFILLNTDDVEVNLIVTTVTMSLFFALLIAGALGALVGWLLPRIRGRGE